MDEQQIRLPEAETAEQLLQQGQELLQQSLSMFELVPVPQVAMAFPDVLSADVSLTAGEQVMDPNEIYIEQAKLFAEQLATVQPSAPSDSPQQGTSAINPDILSLYK